MTDKTTSAETAAAPLDGTELVRIVQAAANFRTTALAIASTVLATDPTMAANSNTVAPTQAAVVAYVQGLINSRAWKNPVRAGTTAALPANTYANGTAGVGATLTATVNGALPAQDGVTLVAADSLLVKNEAAGANNGLYVVTQVGTASLPYILTRRVDENAAAQMLNATCEVSEGTTQHDQIWQCTTDAPIVVGTTALVWSVTGTGGGYTSPTTTKGDLIVRGVTTDSRLGVGTNGQVSTADSTQATGVKWAAVAAAGGATSGTYAARPAAATAGAGALYFATDVLEAYLSNGTAWTVVGSGGAQRFYAELTSAQTFTNSNTPTDITGLQCTILAGEHPLLMEFEGHVSCDTSSRNIRISFVANGALQGIAALYFVTGGTYATITKRCLVQGLTPGTAYTFKVQCDAQTGGTSATVYGDTGAIAKSWFKVTTT